MKPLSELVTSTLQTVETSVANPNTPQAGSMVEAGNKMTHLEKSRKGGRAVDMAIVARLTNRLLLKSLWPTEPTDEHRINRLVLLEETTLLASYDDAVMLVGRFAANFPKREQNERAVVISTIAGSCERHSITVAGLSVALTELLEQATGKNPFIPPTGEILSRARAKSETYRNLLINEKKQLGIESCQNTST